MQNRIPTHFSSKIRSLAVTVFEIKIRNYLTNVEFGRHDCKMQSHSEDTAALHLSGEDNSMKSVLDGFIFDDWQSKILLNMFTFRSLVKSKRRSELRNQRSSSGI
jgi:hypothetical protein